MKSNSKKYIAILIIVMLACLISSILLGVGNMNSVGVYAADTVSLDNTVSKEIDATYTFVPINDTECNVKLTNKSEATIANVPSMTNIDNKVYIVREVAANGFMGASKLKRVTLPNTIRVINNSAFTNCKSLTEITFTSVESIGNYAFMGCTSLQEVIIPKSVITIKNSIFRNNDTLPLCEADEQPSGWSASWNTSNKQTPEYGCTKEPFIRYNPRYNSITAETPIAYSVEGIKYIGYPRNFDNSVNSRMAENEDNIYKIEGDTIVIPAAYDDGNPILEVEQSAFEALEEDTTFKYLIVEYFGRELFVDSFAFSNLKVENVFINRKIGTENEMGESIGIFANAEDNASDSPLTRVFLPNSIGGIPESMFYNCGNLENIEFISPIYMASQEMKNKCDELEVNSIVKLPSNINFYIGDSAFANTTKISEIFIPESISKVGMSVFEGWTENQRINIGMVSGELPEDWNPQWDANCSAGVLFSAYKLFFDAGDGTVDKSDKTVYINEKIGDLPIPQLKDANFAGWYTKGDNGEFKDKFTEDSTFKNTSDLQLYARWQCDIVYEEYSWSRKTFTYEYNEEISLYSYHRSGYNGWYRNVDSGIKYSFADKYIVKRNTTFIAEWEEKPLDDCYQYLTQLSAYGYAIYGPKQLNELRDKVNNNSISVNNVKIMNDINLAEKDWEPFNIIGFHFYGDGNTITYKNENITGDYGFTLQLRGGLDNVNFRAKLEVKSPIDGEKHYVGAIAANIQMGTITDCTIQSFADSIGLKVNDKEVIAGGFAGISYAQGIQDCTNVSFTITTNGTAGGFVGENHGVLNRCINRADITYRFAESAGGSNRAVGGIVGYSHNQGSCVYSCTNYGTITFSSLEVNGPTKFAPCIGQIAGVEYLFFPSSYIKDCESLGAVKLCVNNDYNKYVSSGAVGHTLERETDSGSGSNKCLAEGTLISLADGSQVPVESLKGDELLLVWNLFTGTFDSAPILFLDSEPQQIYEVIHLYFSDGTEVKVISEHAFWDFNLNEYVFLRNDAEKYIGHWFNKQTGTSSGSFEWTKVQLVNVVVTNEYTSAWSPVTYGHLCYYVNGMLSMPGATEGLINIFEVENETLKINEESMQRDIGTYGLFTFEEFAEIYPITEEMFNAFGGQYLKISIGKGMITLEEIGELINRYAEFLN